MNADDIAPDFYEKWDLDRSGGEDELSVLLEAKDIKLGQQGYNSDEPRRVQLRIAASILGSAKRGPNMMKHCAPAFARRGASSAR
ncbi:hypothetical protein [Corynebacterium rhinophilum]|uniref:hypothetical protein n=1 Tax=Corynebacterium rhinophilum TaxID=3050197 RepID=UPI00254A0DD6|nr:hypothetical protein [Corynebacterium sp. MSK082]MDK8647000.1 hypothetical protein [Corynebacterium sp. MSK082]